MSSHAYYNEHDPYAAQWLRNLIAAGHLPDGEVDERSIADVQASDLRLFRQCHFFAGIGGWPLAARLAGWPDDRELWTGSAPCQPFSVAGKGKAQADDRHLWPHLFSLARECRPDVLMGEQVAAAVGKDWLDGVFDDLEGIGYACGAAVVPACAVDAPHRRDRLWFVAHADSERSATGLSGSITRDERLAGVVDDCGGEVIVANAGGERRQQISRRAHGDEGAHERGAEKLHHVASGDDKGQWGIAQWLIGHDGKARRVEPGIRLLAHGVPARVGKLRAYGNAIVPQVAAEVIGAYMDTHQEIAS